MKCIRFALSTFMILHGLGCEVEEDFPPTHPVPPSTQTPPPDSGPTSTGQGSGASGLPFLPTAIGWKTSVIKAERMQLKISSLGWCEPQSARLKQSESLSSVACLFREYTTIKEIPTSGQGVSAQFYMYKTVRGSLNFLTKEGETKTSATLLSSTYQVSQELAQAYESAENRVRSMGVRALEIEATRLPLAGILETLNESRRWATERCRRHPVWQQMRELPVIKGNMLLYQKGISYLGNLSGEQQSFAFEVDPIDQKLISLVTKRALLSEPVLPDVAEHDLVQIPEFHSNHITSSVKEEFGTLSFLQFGQLCDREYNFLNGRFDQFDEGRDQLFPLYRQDVDDDYSGFLEMRAASYFSPPKFKLYTEFRETVYPLQYLGYWDAYIPTEDYLKNNPHRFDEYVKVYGPQFVQRQIQ